jgi:hypothetical protein
LPQGLAKLSASKIIDGLEMSSRGIIGAHDLWHDWRSMFESSAASLSYSKNRKFPNEAESLSVDYVAHVLIQTTS